MRRSLTSRRILIARVAAAAADLLQLGLIPIFAAGGASPPEAILDVVMAVGLTWLLGWHWSFAPSFLAELVPGFDLVPTWSAAVWIATRGGPKGQGDAGAMPGARDEGAEPRPPMS